MPDAAIFLLQEGHSLVELTQQPYDSEALLQELLAKYPRLLAGEQVSPESPRRWLLVSREAGLPDHDGGSDRWSIDHLFLDQDAVPTIIEVKRSSDTRIRREVVGQMLDYAANAVVYWPVERLIQLFATTCESDGQDSERVLSDFLEDRDQDEFWQRVKTNLQAGKVRMMFIADEVPPQLQRIVEFLNGQMNPAEVLALEIRQFVGKDSKTLVPRVIGQTMEAQSKRTVGKEEGSWDRTSLLSTIQEKAGASAVDAAGQIIDWAEKSGYQIYWGKGRVFGSFTPYVKKGSTQFTLFAIYTYGGIGLHFNFLRNKPPFERDEERFRFLEMLNRVPGVRLPLDAINRQPTISLGDIANAHSVNQLCECFRWAFETFLGQGG